MQKETLDRLATVAVTDVATTRRDDTMAVNEALLRRAEALLVERGALLVDGDFPLASGSHSTYYLDSKMLSLDGEGQYLIGELLLALIERYEIDGFGGMEVSAVPLVAAVARASFDRGRPLRGFYVKKTAKGHGPRKKVEGIIPEAGGRVVIIDDVVTTGKSALEAVRAAEALGLKVVAVVALVERHEGGGEAFRARGYDFNAVFRTDESGRLAASGALLAPPAEAGH